MGIKNWKKVSSILREVIDLEASERQTYLDDLNLNKVERLEIEEYLNLEITASSWLESNALDLSKDIFDEEIRNEKLISQRIGVYEIKEEIGFGGMGAVYLASRTDGKFEQRVALKLLKREMNTSALRRRFQIERRILAKLEHPNIARLLNAGTTKDKIPYIAMEYIEGIPINEYCNKHNLDLDQRLKLFCQVCSAVDFAHRNLIVHRDLKPSNILVTKDGLIKLLDFGISKFLSEDLNQLDTETVTKMGVMTPKYASPEQLQNKSVTTASDVYSLGVILYEILSGHRPFEENEDSIGHIYSAVIQTDPPLPSKVITTSSNKTDEITKHDKVPKPKLINSIKPNLLKGDLDNIILKALKKEPERRYSTAENLAEDIKRHQQGIPVTARPDTFTYRASKFIKRNSYAVGAGAVILPTIIGGVLATLKQTRVAKAEATKAKKINDFLQNVLSFSNPHWLHSNLHQDKEKRISATLNEALKNIDRDLANAPEVQSELLFTIGKTFIGQGEFERAEKILNKAINLIKQRSKSRNRRIIPFVLLSQGLQYHFRGELDKALGSFQRALEEILRNGKNDSFEAAQIYFVFAMTYVSLEKFELAADNYQKSYEIAKKSIGERHVFTINVQYRIAQVYYCQGNYNESEKLVTESLKNMQEMFPNRYDQIVYQKTMLGKIYTKQGRLIEAEREIRKALAYLSKLLEEPNPELAWTKFALGEILIAKGRFDEARPLLETALESYVKTRETFIITRQIREELAKIS